jgi:hypothetical protein
MADEDAAVTISKRICVYGGGCPTVPWVLLEENVEEIDGQMFVQLHKHDLGFRRFIGDKNHVFQTMTYLSSLRGLRSKASLESSGSAAAGGLFDELPCAHALKKQKTKATHQLNQGETPATVQLQLEAFTCPDGTEVEAVQVKIKTCINEKTNVHIQLTEAALRYVRFAMVASVHNFGTRARPDAVHWRKSRGRYVGTRTNEDTGLNVTRSFMAEADAKRWVDIGDEIDAEIDARNGLVWEEAEGMGNC